MSAYDIDICMISQNWISLEKVQSPTAPSPFDASDHLTETLPDYELHCKASFAWPVSRRKMYRIIIGIAPSHCLYLRKEDDAPVRKHVDNRINDGPLTPRSAATPAAV